MKRLVFTLALAGALACLLVSVLVSLSSCGKGKSSPATIITARDALPGRNVAATPKVPPLDAMLQQLEQLERPPQANPDIWVSLKAQLEELLVERFGSGKAASAYHPGGTHDFVKARDLTWKPGGTYGKLEWRYVNDGDYDESGTVAIADVTPIAVHYNEEVLFDNSIQELIDEDDEDPPEEVDGDGVVDYRQKYPPEDDPDDLDAIAFNMGVDVAGYKVYGSEDAEGWDYVDTVLFSSRTTSNYRDTFSFSLASGDYTYYKVLAIDGEGDFWWTDLLGQDIVESDVLELPAPSGLIIWPDDYSQGAEDDVVYFHAYWDTGDSPTPISAAWNFQGHVSPNTPTGTLVGVTLGEPCEPDSTCYVDVSNPYGTTRLYFTLEITEAEGVPPDIQLTSIGPLQGDPGEENFTIEAVISGSLPIDYEWNLDGGATPSCPDGTIDEPGEQATTGEVTLGSLGLYNCSLYAENEFGSDTEYFTLTVGTPPVINSISPTSGDSGDEVEFTADVDGSATLSYVWMFGGAADPDFSIDESPLVTLQRGGSVIAGAKVYTVTLTVTNDLGYDSMQVDFPVNAQWHIDEIDSTSSVPLAYTSLEFMSDATPTIVYQRDDSLYYAEKDSGSWSTEEVQSDSGSGHWASHEIDSAGNIHIANYNQDDDCLYYIVGVSGDWEDPVEVPDDQYDNFGQYCDIAVNSYDEPGISFHNLSELTLMYATYDGEDWTVERVEPDSQPLPGYYGEYTSIKFNSNDVPRISYSGLINASNPATRKLKYAYRSGGNPPWTREFALSTDFGGYYSSLELDSDDVPIIMHEIEDSQGMGDLWHVAYGLGSWDTDEVDSGAYTPGAGAWCSLELDPDDRAAVSYQDTGQSLPLLKYAFYFALDWDIREISQPSGYGGYLAGYYTSLANDPSYFGEEIKSYPAISYVIRYGATYRLMYAYWW